MSHVEVLTLALLASLALNYLYAWLDRKGCRCDKCSFHVNERNMERLREQDAFIGQEELRHEIAHKGFGYSDDGPDKYMCMRADCPRNKVH